MALDSGALDSGALDRRATNFRACGCFALATLLGLLSGTAAAHAQPASDARLAYEAGNYTRAHDLWLPLANAGDADAAFRLGLLADLGQGMPENAEAAYRWYRRAAQAGQSQAEFNVAVMQDSGRGTAHDVAAAAVWYARAAAHGNHRAQYNLALLYSDGDGVPRNQAAARAWFHLAAADLPAAAAKLRAMGPDNLPAVNLKGNALGTATPIAPQTGNLVPSDDDGTAEIVWSAPAEAMPVRYFLQVVTRGNGVPHEVFAAYLDVTAALVKLDATQHAYAWRVFTVSSSPASYSTSSWTDFTS